MHAILRVEFAVDVVADVVRRPVRRMCADVVGRLFENAPNSASLLVHDYRFSVTPLPAQAATNGLPATVFTAGAFYHRPGFS